MTGLIHLGFILAAAFVATASPGPATMAISGTSLASGRRLGLAVASGVTTGSLMWSTAAAFGLSAVMLANVWLFNLIRDAGVLYLGWLAIKAARSAWSPKSTSVVPSIAPSWGRAFRRGLSLHLTNPKAILFFGALYSLGVPPGSNPAGLATIIGAVGLQSFLLFHGYAILFSLTPVARGYAKLRRWFDAVFALAFGVASLRLLTASVR